MEFLAFLVAAGAVCATVDASNSTLAKAAKTDKFLMELAKDGIFAGTASIFKNGEEVYAGAFGEASMELGAEMRPELRFPVGSNSKLFTSIGIFQLRERGLLSLNDPIANFLTDVLDNKFCPVIHDDTNGTCQELTLRDLLVMQSCLLDISVDDPTSAAWIINRSMTKQSMRLDEWFELAYNVGGDMRIADMLRGFPELLPADTQLTCVPGPANTSDPLANTITYNNLNWIVLAHVVETVSGKSLRDYLLTNIMSPFGLQHEYAPDLGTKAGFLKNSLAGGASYLQTLDVTDSEPFWSLSSRPAASGAMTLDGQTAPLAIANGAGGVIGNARDQARFYLGLLQDPAKVGLNATVIEEILAPTGITSGMPSWAWGSGIFVRNPNDPEKWLGDMFYAGGIDYFTTWIHGWKSEGDTPPDALALFKNTYMISAGTLDTILPEAVGGSGKISSSCDVATGECTCWVTNTTDMIGSNHLCNIIGIDPSTSLPITYPFFDANYITSELVEIWGLGEY